MKVSLSAEELSPPDLYNLQVEGGERWTGG